MDLLLVDDESSLRRTLRLTLLQAGLAAIADYFVTQWLVLPIFYMAAIGN